MEVTCCGRFALIVSGRGSSCCWIRVIAIL